MSTIDKILNFIKSIIEFIISFFVSIASSIWDLLVFIFNLFIKHPVGFILCILAFYYLIVILIDLVRHFRYKQAFNNTVALVKYEFGHSIYCYGPIRSGKSTCMVALTHVFTYILQQAALETIQKTKNIIIKADWNKVDAYVKELYLNKINIQTAVLLLIDRFPQWLTGRYYSHINLIIDYEKLINSYVEAQYSILENNYVLSPRITPIYNRLTKTFSKTLIEPNLKLKEAYDKKVFALSRYKIICVDEKGLDPDKKNTSTMANASVDDGYNEGLKIIGNAGKETMYLITTNQDFFQYLRAERSLFTTIVEMKGIKILPRWKIVSKCLIHLQELVNFFYKISTAFKFTAIRKNAYRTNENIYKKFLRRITLWNDFIFSKAYICYSVNLYSSEQDIGKRNTSETTYYQEKKLIFPITYAFGNLDTHVYSFVFDELMKNSEVSFFDVPTNYQDLTDEDKAQLVQALLDRTEKAIEKKKRKKEETVTTKEEIPVVEVDFLEIEKRKKKND